MRRKRRLKLCIYLSIFLDSYRYVSIIIYHIDIFNDEYE